MDEKREPTGMYIRRVRQKMYGVLAALSEYYELVLTFLKSIENTRKI